MDISKVGDDLVHPTTKLVGSVTRHYHDHGLLCDHTQPEEFL
jgi:hypothetical protein